MSSILRYEQCLMKAKEKKIYTLEELKKDKELYKEFWLSSCDISKSLTRFHYNRTKLCQSLNCFNDEDIVSEFTIKLVNNFDNIMKMLSSPRIDEKGNPCENNLKGYTAISFKRFLSDSVKKCVVTQKETILGQNNKEHHISSPLYTYDENKEKRKIYYSLTSLSAPISEDNSLSLEDTLIGDINKTPEAMLVEAICRAEAFEYLKGLFKRKKYVGCIYIFINDMLIEFGHDSSLNTNQERFKNYDKATSEEKRDMEQDLINDFNNDLMEFISNFSMFDYPEAHNHYVKSFDMFGKNYNLSPAKVSHLREEYQKAISKIFKHPIPQKYTKSKKTDTAELSAS